MSRDITRVLSKIEVGGDDECWPWTGFKQHNGYGKAILRGQRGAHRVVFILLGGRIPDGFDIDHLCRNRLCVNPQHLDPVTRRENLARSPFVRAAVLARRTHCKRGHPFTEETTWWDPKRNARHCRVCDRLNAAKRKGAVE